jgi:hypothetical protein
MAHNGFRDDGRGPSELAIVQEVLATALGTMRSICDPRPAAGVLRVLRDPLGIESQCWLDSQLDRGADRPAIRTAALSDAMHYRRALRPIGRLVVAECKVPAMSAPSAGRAPPTPEYLPVACFRGLSSLNRLIEAPHA